MRWHAVRGHGVYKYNLGDGYDKIEEGSITNGNANGGDDVIAFCAGITANDINLNYDETNLAAGQAISIGNNGSIQVLDGLDNPNRAVEHLQFVNNGNIEIMVGDAGANQLNGSDGSDFIKDISGIMSLTGFCFVDKIQSLQKVV